jgi:putative ABC transport system permease protein
VLGELKPGVGETVAQAQVSRISSDLAREYPDANANVSTFIVRLDSLIVQSVRTPVLLLFAGSTIILIVAWFHLSSVFLTLALERIHEAGIRLALGATRIDLFRLFLTEVGAIAIGAWLLAIVIGRAGIRYFVGIAPNLVPRFDETNVDARVAITALVLCIAAALLIAIWLTWRVAGIGISAVINESRGNALAPRHRIRSTHFLLAGQIAATAGLAICAIFLFKEYRRIEAEGSGFAALQSLTARVSLPSVSYPKPDARIRFVDQLIDELRGVPGLDHVSAVSRVPLSSDGRFKGVEPEGQSAKSSEWNTADYFSAMPGYFQTIGISMLAGRDFRKTDAADAPGVVIVDERFAARFWPNQNALGKKVKIGGNANEPRPWLEVIGIVAHVRDDVGRNVIPFQAYFPYYQDPGALMTLTVRSAHPTRDVLTTVREKLRRLDPHVPLYFVSTLDSIVAESLAAQRTATALLGLFALFALVLSIAGTYGIVSGSVIGRERELFVRMALGASYRDILALVLRETVVCVAIGVAIGGVLILFASKSLTHLWAGFSAIGWTEYGLGLVFVVLSALIAAGLSALLKTDVRRAVSLLR